MPGVVVQPLIPSEVKEKLDDLDCEYKDGDITKKGYCKKKWKLLEPLVSADIVHKVQALQKKFATTNLTEAEYCDQIIQILDETQDSQKCSPLNENQINSEVNEKEHRPNEEPQAKSPRKAGAISRKPENGSKVITTNYDSKECKENTACEEKSKGKLPQKKREIEEEDINGKDAVSNDEVCMSSTPRKEKKALTPLKKKEMYKMAKGGKDAINNDNYSEKHIEILCKASSSKNGATELKMEIEESTSNKRRSGRKSLSVSDECQVAGASTAQKSPVESATLRRTRGSAGTGKQTDIVSMFHNSVKRKHKETNGEEADSFSGEKKSSSEKKIKSDVNGNVGEDQDTEPPNKIMKSLGIRGIRVRKETSLKASTLKCAICRQLLEDPDLGLYQGHPEGAVEEDVAIVNAKLQLFTGNEEVLHEGDERPQNKLTHFSVYDKAGHLCPFDTGLIEGNVLLYISGYMKAIYEENPDIEGGIPTKDVGPINEWWVSGFDGGELAIVGFSTGYGDYYLMEPSEDYAPLMEAVKEKIFLSKLVIEFLVDDNTATYEDLLNRLHTAVPPKGLTSLSEDCLLRHAQFVCDQVLSFDSAALSHEDLLIVSPCMRALVKLSGVTIGKRLAMRRADRREYKSEKPKWTKATTTPLVQECFEAFFTEQLDKDVQLQGPRRKRCGVCESCQQADCGTCPPCLDMLKFGGTGRNKQACAKRRCPNMALEEAEDNDLDNEENIRDQVEVKTEFRKSVAPKLERKVTWVGSGIQEREAVYYRSATVGGVKYSTGDCVVVDPGQTGVPYFVARICYMLEDKRNNKHFHAQWFCRGSETVLGETANHMELFLVEECDNIYLSAISGKATVVHQPPPENWAELGGCQPEHDLKDDGNTFFYQKRYNKTLARFEDPEISIPRKEKEHRFCGICDKSYDRDFIRLPKLDDKLEEVGSEARYGSVSVNGIEYKVGMTVFLKPDAFKFKTSAPPVPKKAKEKADEDLYPEFYRKSDSANVKGSNEETPRPFCIGYISHIFTMINFKLFGTREIKLRVNKFYRPENTHRGAPLSQQADLNMLYWTDEETTVSLADVTGTCYVLYGENIEVTTEEWIKKGPYRFYFNQAYNSKTQCMEEPPSKATAIGRQKGKGKGKGKGKSKKSETVEDLQKPVTVPEWPAIPHKLKCLDVFAGCGGLSEGLHESGIAETKWAIELEESAANAFKLNNKEATVFTEDCNLLLKLVLNGKELNDKNQVLPQKGDVELLCGGPPCQGFSGMNRFNSREYSKFKNSLIVSYLSFCEYYRPKYFILENVRNFVSFKNSIILKLTLRCLVDMGYQCTFGILQAGNYGVPQTRRRLIILAAAPGLALPQFPEPMHTFSLKASQLSCVVGEKKYVSNCKWSDSAPFRTITVRDAMSDLPDIRNGHQKQEMSYGGEAVSHFQRLMRGNQYQPILRDHICKDMAALVEARIAHIPTASGSDWRDLPNMVVRLSDGTFTKKLVYTHNDKKNGKSSSGALRGVCPCASGSKNCDPMDRQYNTLIPWCLPHTGNRHNHWAGLYGRLEWDGFFSTTVTNPEPMGKQGRVLHPEQTRVVSVRECARSQGFPDTYRFFGSILDKHRQVGNAVPPPMGAAIGFEIRKSWASSHNKQLSSSSGD